MFLFDLNYVKLKNSKPNSISSKAVNRLAPQNQPKIPVFDDK